MLKIQYDQYEFSQREWFRYISEGVLTGVLVNILCYRTWWALGICIPISMYYIRFKRHALITKRKKEVQKGFQDALNALVVALRAGYSMENAVSEAVRDLKRIYSLKHPIVREFEHIQNQLHVRVPVENLFQEFGERSGVEDIKNFASVYCIAKRSGGNLSKILQNTAKILYDKMEVQKEIEACIAAKEMEQGIMAIVPGGMILYIQLTSPGFLNVLYGNFFGACVMTVCLIIYLVSFAAGRKIVAIEV